MKSLFTASAVLLLASGSAHALTVTPTTDANALADLLEGSGASITNPVLSGADIDGNPLEVPAGIFSGGDFGLTQGFLLSTGDVGLADGPNSAPNTSDSEGIASTTFTFDFDTETGEIFFRYVFASEEYPEFVDTQFNDIFQLEINGENVALIPGTDVEVSINTVNEDENSQFFRDNEGDQSDLEYDGLTTVLTARATGLALTGNTARFFITDRGDTIYDSAVFIQAGSFSTDPDPDPTPVPAPAALVLFGLGVAVLGAARRR